MIRTLTALLVLSPLVASADARVASHADLIRIVQVGRRIDARLTAHVDTLSRDLEHANQLVAASDKEIRELIKAMLSRNPNQAALKIIRGRVTKAIEDRLTARGANPLAAQLVAKQLVASID